MSYVLRPWPYSASGLPRLRRGDPLWADAILVAIPWGAHFVDLVSRRLITYDPGPTPFRREPAPGSRWPATYGDGDNSYVHAYRFFSSVGTGPFTLVTGYYWGGTTDNYQTPVGFGGYGVGTNIGIYTPWGGAAGQDCGIDSTAMGTVRLNGMAVDAAVRSYGYSVTGSGQVARGYKDGIYTGDSAGALTYDETDSAWINKAQGNEGAWGWHLYDILFRRVLTDAEHRELAPDRIWRHLEPAGRIYIPAAAVGNSLTGSVTAQSATAVGDAIVAHTASGDVTAQAAPTVGDLTRDLPLTGDVFAQGAAATGDATIGRPLSGDVAADAATTSGDIAVGSTVSGDVVAGDATATGDATITHSLSGDPVADVATAVGDLSVTGAAIGLSGDVAAQDATAAGDLGIDHTVSGDASAEAASASGSVTLDHPASGAVSAQTATASGSLEVGTTYQVEGRVAAQEAGAAGELIILHQIAGDVTTEPAQGNGEIIHLRELSGAAYARPAGVDGLIRTETEAQLAGLLKRKKAKNVYATRVRGKVVFDTSERKLRERVRKLRAEQPEFTPPTERIMGQAVAIPKERLRAATVAIPEAIEQALREVEAERKARYKAALTVILTLID